MKKYNIFFNLFLVLLITSCCRTFKLKTVDFNNFNVSNTSVVLQKFESGIYISQICKQSVLAEDRRSPLIAFSPCKFNEFKDFNDLEVKQTLALIFLDNQRFIYCTSLQENGKLLNAINLSQQKLEKENNQDYKPFQAHVFRGYYRITDTVISLEMELPEKFKFNGFQPQQAHKITITGSLRDNSILFKHITYVQNKSDISVNNNDLNEIDIASAIHFAPAFTFHQHAIPLKEESTYMRSSTKFLFKKLDEGGVVRELDISKEHSNAAFDSFKWDTVQLIVDTLSSKMTIVHHIKWMPVRFKIPYKKDSIVFENKQIVCFKDSLTLSLSAKCLKNAKLRSEKMSIPLNDKMAIDSLSKVFFSDYPEGMDYWYAHRYSKFVRRDYNDYQTFTFDNKSKPVQITVLRDNQKSKLYKTHLYIGVPDKSELQEVDSITIENDIRFYWFRDGTSLKEDVNKKVITW